MSTVRLIEASSLAALLLACEGDPAGPTEELRDTTDVWAPYAAFDSGLAIADVRPHKDAVVVVARNAMGDAIGRISLEPIGEDAYELRAEYADGGGVIVVDTRSESISSKDATLPESILAERARGIGDVLGHGPQAWEPGWTSCGIHVALAAALCTSTGPLGWLGCAAGAATAGCECIKAANNGKANKPCGKEERKK